MAIESTGQLIYSIKNAAQQNGLGPRGQVFVRVGKTGPEYEIQGMVVRQDLRGNCLVLELKDIPRS
jgi:hypothetical protein